MFSKLIQLMFVTTSLSPVLLTLGINSYIKYNDYSYLLIYLSISILLLFILRWIIKIALKKLEIASINIMEISNADNESILFIFTYLLPLIELNSIMLIYLLILFYFVVYNSNIYHFNPMLNLIGYHQYQIKLKDGISFILITKKKLISSKQVKNVVQLTNYILLEKE